MRSAPGFHHPLARRDRLRRLTSATALIALFVAGMIGFSSASATATPTTGTISGVVTDGATDAIMGNVSVYLSGLGALSQSYSTTSDSATGRYEFDDLPLGYYQVSVQGDYSYPQVYQAPADAVVDLTPTDNTSVTDIAFAEWPTGTATVSGAITMSDTGLPAVGVDVQLVASDTGAPGQSYFSEQVATDSNGHYEIDNLLPYSYSLELSFPQSLGSWDVNSPPVEVTSPGQSLVRNGQIVPWLAATSEVRGTLVDGTTGDPVDGADVELDSSDNGSTYSAITGSDGSFEFDGVVPGSFTANITATGYTSRSIPLGVYDYQKDDLGSITLYATTASISGTVVASDSTSIDSASVYAQSVSDPLANGYASVLPDGSYDLSGLEPGTYTLSIGDYLDGLLSQTERVVVTAGVATAADFTLNPVSEGSSISGVVTDSNDQPLSGICEAAYDADGDVVGSGSYYGTGPDGAYSITGLDAGTYTVLFSDCGNVLTHASTYLGDAYALGTARMVTLGLNENSDVTENNVQMVAGGTIGGHVDVSAPGGDVPFPDGSLIVPTVQQLVDGTWVDWVNQTALAGIGAGDYQVNGLPPGQFRLEFADTNEGVRTYDTQWWSSATPNGIATPDASSIITLAAGQVSTDKDAHMKVPEPNTDPTAPSDTTANEAGISATDQVQQGDDLTVDVGSDLAGDWISLWGHSSPVLLGDWAQVSATGTVTVPVPTSLPAGSHHLIAQTSDGTVLGSLPLTVTAAPPPPPATNAGGTSASSSDHSIASSSASSGAAADAESPSSNGSTATPAPTSTPRAKPITQPSASAPQRASPASPFPLWLIILFAALAVVIVALIVFGFSRRIRGA